MFELRLFKIRSFASAIFAGLSNTLPTALTQGLTSHSVPAAAADKIANVPPVGSLFAAFLGYNPIQTLLQPTGILAQLPKADSAALTGKEFFPNLIAGPFHSGLVIVFLAAAIMSVVAAIASFVGGKRFVYADDVEAPAAAGQAGPEDHAHHVAVAHARHAESPAQAEQGQPTR
jgi:hypothetical protein